MLSAKVANAIAIAIAASVASGLARVAAAVAQFYGLTGSAPASLAIFALAAFAAGVGAAIYANTNAPAKPPGWRPAQPWAFERLAPATLCAGLMLLILVLSKLAASETSEFLWKVAIDSSTQFAFALLLWEQRWVWSTFTPAPGAPSN